MSGILYIVGTPIGNLKDITFRAVEVLKSVDIIACEDTRHSRILLSQYDIKKPLLSYYKQKEKESSAKIISEIKSGKSVALITDAGMPTISDPGAILVSEARQAGVTVSVVPGPSAVISAIALSGIISKGFSFLGFMPEKRKDKIAFLSNFVNSTLPLVFYSAPHNIYSDIAFLYSVLGDRKIYAVKEITKIYESVIECSLADFDVGDARGEYVLIVEGAANEVESDISPEVELNALIIGGMDKKEAIKAVASRRKLPKNEIYKLTLK